MSCCEERLWGSVTSQGGCGESGGFQQGLAVATDLPLEPPLSERMNKEEHRPQSHMRRGRGQRRGGARCGREASWGMRRFSRDAL